MKKLLGIAVLCLLWCNVGYAEQYDYLKDPLHEDNTLIRFSYKGAIKGMEIFGTFNPQEWSCGGHFKGIVQLTFKRIKDKETFEFSRDNVSFIKMDICIEPGETDCKFKNDIVLEYQETEYFTDETPLKIVDFDFDGKDEIILMRGCGYRGGPEFEAYEFNNNQDNFDVHRAQFASSRLDREMIDGSWHYNYGRINNSFYYTWNAEFDQEKKELFAYGSGGMCLGSGERFRSDGERGYKLIEVVTKGFNEGGECIQSTFKIDAAGNEELIRKEVLHNN